MAEKFKIEITAVDKATAVVRKVNVALGTVSGPITDLGTSIASLGREAGLDKLGRGFVSVGRAAGDVARRVAGIVAPLAAVTGIGSIAGVAGLAARWAGLGAEVGKTSNVIGLAADRLQSLRGAGERVGVSAEATTAGLRTLGNTLQDALYGRNQEALAMMNRLGLQLHRTKDGTVDTARAFMDLANAIAHIKNPQVQQLVARTFGLEELLPLLQKGSAGIAQLEARMRSFGAIMSDAAIAAATRFKESLVDLGFAFVGVRNAIGEKLMPVLTPMIDSLSRWIASNRELIATNVVQFATGLAEAIKGIDWKGVSDGVKEFVGDVRKLVEWIGGWDRAAVAVAAVMAGPLVAGIVAVGAELVALGATLIANPVGAAVTAAAVAIGYAAYKIYENWDGIKEYFSSLWESVTGIFDRAWGRLKPIVNAVAAPLVALGLTSTPINDALAAGAANNAVRTQGWAEAANAVRTDPEPVATPYTPAAAPTAARAPVMAPPAAALPDQAGGAVQVLITLANAPPGTSAVANTTGNVQARVNIQTTLPGARGVP